MEKMIYIYIFAILILCTIYIAVKLQKHSHIAVENLFKRIIFFTVLMLIIDIGHEYLNGVSGSFNAFFIRFLSILIYALPSVIAVTWFSYTHHLLYRRPPKKNIYYAIFLMPIVVNFILSFLSLIWPLYFTINSENTYARGNIYLLSIILQYLYLIVPMVMVIANRNKIQNQKFYPLVFFTIPPMIGGLIQAFNYGLLLFWPMLSFSIFVGYIFIQSRLIAIDYLTGVMNKGAFENHIEGISLKNRKNKKLSATIFDLDGLKLINDNYGHMMGDKVLSLFAETLRNSFGRSDFIARVGGDEFIILRYVNDNEETSECLNKLSKILKTINERKTFPAEISFSYGSRIIKEEINQTVKGLIEEIDLIMYKSKAIKNPNRDL